MKKKSTLHSLLIAVITIIYITNCTGQKKENAPESHNGDSSHTHVNAKASESIPTFQVDSNFQKQLANVFTAYINVKDAFVESNFTAVKTLSNNINEALSNVDMTLLSGAAHNDWMTYLSSIESSLKEIESTSDIETQRIAFATLSDTLYKTAKAFGVDGKQLFYQYCPMAFNNEGAYWLSDKEQIRNPYFGDKMLTCGSVKEKLE